MEEITVVFSGNRKIDARLEGFTVKTDQPTDSGGDGSAPAPFELFLASIATCAGFYVLSFCQSRKIPADGIKIVQRIERDEQKHMVGRISIDISLPADFPEKYVEAVIRAADSCTVKKHIFDPPKFEIRAERRQGPD